MHQLGVYVKWMTFGKITHNRRASASPVERLHLGAEIGITMVLHTNSINLNFHPHIHAVVPGGGINKRSRQWKKERSGYLFSHKALAMVFRARFLAGLKNGSLLIPKNIPSKWVVDCTEAGKGISALKYLSRYLYRGVISEKNIVSN